MNSVRSGRGYRWLLGALLVLAGIALHQNAAHAQDVERPVYVIRVHGAIDLGLAPYVSRVLGDAEAAGARAVILEIDSSGGRLEAVRQVSEAVLDSPVRTIAFVNRTAVSEAALVALAADEIYMAPGATLDAAVEADGVAADRAELLAMSGLDGSSVVETSPGLAESAVRFLTNPVVAALLISLGILLLLVELFTAGFGLAGVLGLALLALFFWGHFIAGLAGWEGVALVAVGLALIALEVFVIPGFGVAGILGLLALMGGLFISLIDDEIVTREAIVRAGSTIGLAVFTIVAGGMALLWLLPRLPWLRGLVLQTNVALPEPVGGGWSLFLADMLDRDRPGDRAHPAASETRLSEGATGVALSDLRPGGYAQIGGMRIDVVSRGEYIPAGEPIAVIADEGYRRVVRRADESDTGAPDADVSGVR